MIRQEEHLFMGLKRDNYPINQKAQLLWDARNIRFTNIDDNTMLSITNEKGTSDSLVTIEGLYVGHCVLGEYLVLFTNAIVENIVKSYIYRIEYNKDKDRYYSIKLVEADNLFNSEYPIEAIGLYETLLILKVYWVDGKHLPRFINIAKPELRFPNILLLYKDKIDLLIDTIEELRRTEELGGDTTTIKNKLNSINTALLSLSNNILSSFNIKLLDFSTTVLLDESIEITKLYGYGLFSPGVILYAFSYYNKYELESSIFYTSQLLYITFIDRGGKLDESSIPVTFNIQIDKPDTNFEYIRIYSIQRSLLDSSSVNTRIVGDIKIDTTKEIQTYFFLDNGSIGLAIDSNYLLYVGGKELIAQTLCLKDNTLFLGNITTKQDSNIDSIKEIILNNYKLDNYTVDFEKEINDNFVYYYFNRNTLLKYNAIFKAYENYRLGILVLYENGLWSEPIFLKDDILCKKYPFEYSKANYTNSKKVVLSKKSEENNPILGLYDKGARRIRTCIVYPNAYERDVICLGVLNPTVYNIDCRKNNAPFAMASWIFRPTTSFSTNAHSATSVSLGAKVEFRHDRPLRTRFKDTGGISTPVYRVDRGMEVLNMYINSENDSIDNITSDNIDDYRSYFYVDENIVTLNSPDIEIDRLLVNYNYEGAKLRIIGKTYLGATAGDIELLASDTINPDAKGFVKTFIGHTTLYYKDLFAPISNVNNYAETLINGGLVSGCFFEDSEVFLKDNKYLFNDLLHYWFTCLWGKLGSINNDVNRDDSLSTRSAVLRKKIIANLKYFKDTTDIVNNRGQNYPIYYNNITTPKLFNSDTIDLVKINAVYSNQDLIYMGNIDYLNINKNEYPTYKASSIFSNTVSTEHDTGYLTRTTDPVRIKYKSSPHLVFSLNGKIDLDGLYIDILPRSKSFSNLSPTIDGELPVNDIIKDSYTPIPEWCSIYSSLTENNSEGYYLDCVFDIGYENTLLVFRLFGGNLGTMPTSYIGSIDLVRENDGSYRVYRYTKKLGYYSIDRILLRASDIPEGGLIVKCFPGFTNSEKYKGDTPEYKDQYLLLNNTSSEDYNDKSKEYSISTTETDTIYYKQYKTDKHVKFYRITPSYIADDAGDWQFFNIEYLENEDYTIGTNYKLVLKKFSDILTNITDPTALYTPPYLLMAELYRDNIVNKFGGDTPEALLANLWLPASEPVKIDTKKDSIEVPYYYGDTWYSRYDCLKTYPYSTSDENLVVEIGSFMCETRVNIDCRTDINRGNLSNLTALPENFNLFNPVYSLKNNFFNYSILPDDFHKLSEFLNMFIFSTMKTLGEDIDTFSKVNIGSSSNLSGEFGKITAIRKWNEYLIAFLEKAISRILFNSKVLIPVSEGVPIEITNNYKVDGALTLSDIIGCTNKWSIVETPSGIMFIDSNTNNIYSFGKEAGLTPIADALGMSQWIKTNNPEALWSPYSKENNGIRTFYDSKNLDVYFSKGLILDLDNKEILEDALCYSLKLELFTSFMSYSGICAMFNFNNGLYSIKNLNNEIKLYLNNVGKYNEFYGEIKPYSISFISNGYSSQENNVNLDKIFDTIEYRADLYDGQLLLNISPFNKILVHNEYQDTHLVNINSVKKFRIWRSLIPRDFKNKRDRIRNLWSCIKLENSDPLNNKMIFTSLGVKYSI